MKSFDFELNSKDYIDFNLYNLNNSTTIKKSLIAVRVLLSVIILIMTLALVKQGNVIGYIYFAVIWSLIMFFFPKGFRSRMKRRIGKILNEGKNAYFLGPWSIKLLEDGIVTTNSYSESKTRWDGIEKIIEGEEHIFIYVGVASAFIIPKRAFPDNNGIEEFLTTLRSMMSRGNS
ncbi:YcxB family protein [Desulfosporosinus sp. SYSU MS00001]|uniref:YcxB family protein n=1 Tax=Desulfosporosinus sp. SYSU MS00001 TaxID=3416284 RepID=UPI003CEF4985